MFKDWVIENNLIIAEHWHGISLYGAINCKIVNNTLVENPLNLDATMVPWIKITAHKDGRKATGNLIRNNFTSSMANDANIGNFDNNITSKNYTAHFTNYAGSDFHLKRGSPAINVGSNVNVPSIDLGKNPRVVPYDIGCYEYPAVTGITEANRNISAQIYPNPMGESAIITLSQEISCPCSVILHDLQGRIVFEHEDISGKEIKINREGIRNGMYLLTVKDSAGKDVIAEKFIIQ